jgi:hypothetical protein
MTTTTTFTIGQTVSFTLMTQRGLTINFKSRSGVVHELCDEVAVVKTRNGKLHRVPVDDLRAEGQRSALTEAVLSGLGVEVTSK